MFDHVEIRVADRDASERFYNTVLSTLGIEQTYTGPDIVEWGEFGVAGAPTENVHIAFPTTDDAVVQAFHRTATEAGYRDNGRPCERPHYHPGYYAAFVLDPDGNNVEVVNHHR